MGTVSYIKKKKKKKVSFKLSTFFLILSSDGLVATVLSNFIVLIEDNICVDMSGICLGSTYKAHQMPE